jgi:transposase InsO family protein
MAGRDVPLSLRRTIVEISLDGLNVREFCRCHRVSPWFFYDLRRRYRAEGEAALALRSRAAKRVANRTRPELEDMIVGLRKQLSQDGLDCGPATIRFHLCQALDDPAGTRTPSEATIWRVLTRRGFVVAQPKKAPKGSRRRFVAERANECWQIDDTGWALADESPVKIIDVLDDCSRVVVAAKAVRTCSGAAALEAVLAGAALWGLPERMLSDNGPAFRDSMAKALGQLGVGYGHSRPYHPQTCGKVERFHQTLKKFLAAQEPAATLEDLQAQIDRFVAYYNHQRPHRGIGRRIPAQVWTDSPKSGPADRPLGTPTAIYYSRATLNGVISTGLHRDNTKPGRTMVINLGRAHAHQPTTTVITGTSCHVFIDGRLIRQLTLDPTRRYQRLTSRSKP